MVLIDIIPVLFFIIIVFGISFGLTYSLFDGNLTIMLSLFALLLGLAFAGQIIHARYYPIFFISIVLALYLEFKEKIGGSQI